MENSSFEEQVTDPEEEPTNDYSVKEQPTAECTTEERLVLDGTTKQTYAEDPKEVDADKQDEAQVQAQPLKSFPNYTRQVLVGSGGTGKAYTATLDGHIPSRVVLVKKIPLSLVFGTRTKEISEMEEAMLLVYGLDHDNILKHLIHTIEPPSSLLKPHYFTIMTEYYEGGTLANKATNGLLFLWIQHYTKQLVNAVIYLHSKDLIHRDIKGENIFLSGREGEHLVLGDFGDMKKLKKSVTGKLEVGRAGTDAFMAPEVAKASYDGMQIGRKSDIWSIGCVVVMMSWKGSLKYFVNESESDELTLLTDPEAAGCQKLRVFISKGGRPAGTGHCIDYGYSKTPEDLSLIKFQNRTLKANPDLRPSAYDLSEDHFLTTKWSDRRSKSDNKSLCTGYSLKKFYNMYSFLLKKPDTGIITDEGIMDNLIRQASHHEEATERQLLSTCFSTSLWGRLANLDDALLFPLVKLHIKLPTTLWEKSEFHLTWKRNDEYINISDIRKNILRANMAGNDSAPRTLGLPRYELNDLVKEAIDGCANVLDAWKSLKQKRLDEWDLVDYTLLQVFLKPLDKPSHYRLKIQIWFPLLPFRPTESESIDDKHCMALFAERPDSAYKSPRDKPLFFHYLADVLTQLAYLYFPLSSRNPDEHLQLYELWRYMCGFPNAAGELCYEPEALRFLPRGFADFVNDVPRCWKGFDRKRGMFTLPSKIRTHQFISDRNGVGVNNLL